MNNKTPVYRNVSLWIITAILLSHVSCKKRVIEGEPGVPLCDDIPSEYIRGKMNGMDVELSNFSSFNGGGGYSTDSVYDILGKTGVLSLQSDTAIRLYLSFRGGPYLSDSFVDDLENAQNQFSIGSLNCSSTNPLSNGALMYVQELVSYSVDSAHGDEINRWVLSNVGGCNFDIIESCQWETGDNRYHKVITNVKARFSGDFKHNVDSSDTVSLTDMELHLTFERKVWI